MGIFSRESLSKTALCGVKAADRLYRSEIEPESAESGVLQGRADFCVGRWRSILGACYSG